MLFETKGNYDDYSQIQVCRRPSGRTRAGILFREEGNEDGKDEGSHEDCQGISKMKDIMNQGLNYESFGYGDHDDHQGYGNSYSYSDY